jgi:CO/xanthine dehydrogenase Mo-binding subunit
VSARHSQLTRRAALKGGALVIGFSLIDPKAAWAARGDKAGPPNPETIDTWIAIHTDNTATIYFGKCELGQGSTTGLLQVAAEELNLGMDQVRAVRLDTNISPNQGPTSSSSSIHRDAPKLRLAAAEARQALMARAARRMGVQSGSLTITRGVISVRGENGLRSVTYGELLGDKPFDVKFTGTAPLKPAGRYTIVGQSPQRVDIPDKAAAKYEHVQHVRVPGMLHGRIVLPRGQGAFSAGARVKDYDESSIKHIPGVQVVRKSGFIGVVAEREWDAVKAAQELKVTWQDRPALSGNDKLFASMRAEKTTDTIIVNAGNADKAMASAAHIRGSTYYCPYQGHLPFAPNCAVADVTPERAHIRCSSQDIYNARSMLSTVLGMPVEKILVQYYESSGTFGRSCYEDAAQAAAILSQAVGRPVRLQYMRWDEHGWDNYGPAHLAEVKAGVDAKGNITAYEYHGWQHGWTITSTVQDSATGKPGRERAEGSGSITVNPISTGSMYKIAHRKVVSHAVPMAGYLRGAALRSPLDLSFAFASEQTIDELAVAVGMDPLAFRRQNIGDQRWLGVLDAAAKAAGWKPRVMGTNLSKREIVTGRGLGLGTHHVSYGAAVADIEVNRRTGLIIVKKLWGAMDAGMVVNPGLVENQMVGQMIQSVSRILKEEVTFDAKGVTSLDWNSYPILRFAEHPEIVPIVVQRMDEPSTGAGEEVMGATVAAIANAFYDATGVRMRQYPMTPERVLAALNGKSGQTAI